MFRGSKEIYLKRRPVTIPKNIDLRAVITTKVGGVFGFGGSLSKTSVIFNQQQFYPGDTCEVKLICDNSQCLNAVKSFKIKFKRKIFARGERVQMYLVDTDDEVLKTSKYLY